MDYLIFIIIFFVGAAVGSFAHVVALRYNTGLSFVGGKSRCLFCNTEITSEHLVPIFSFIHLGGRCPHCKTRLSFSYILSEIVSGVIVLMLFLKFGLSVEFFILSTMYYVLSIIFVYDLQHKIIPDPFVFLFVFISFIFSVFFSTNSVFMILFSGIVVPLPFFLIWLFSGGRLLGFGDVKFMLGMGFLFGWKSGFEAVFLSFWIGAGFIGCVFLFRLLSRWEKGLTMKSEVPFAPFLVLGTLTKLLFHVTFF